MIHLGYVADVVRPHDTHDPREYPSLKEAFADLFSNPTPVEVPEGVEADLYKKQCPAFTAGVVPAGQKVIKANVQYLDLLVVDLDDIPTAELAGLLERLDGLEYIFYTSWKHAKDQRDTWRCRLILSLDRPVPNGEWLETWRRARAALGVARWMDSSCKDSRRLYFLPYYNAANLDPGRSEYRPGAPLPVDLLPPVKAAEKVADKRANSIELETLLESWKRRPSTKPYAARLKKALEGKPFAPSGEREVTAFALADRLAYWLPEVEAESLTPYFRVAFEKMEREGPGCPTVDDFVAKVKAQQIFYAEQQDRNKAEEERQQAEAREHTDKPWIVAHKESYYVLNDHGGYYGPHTRTSFLATAEEELTRLDGFDAYRQTDNGPVRKAAIDLVSQYGRVAEDVIHDISAQASTYDPKIKGLILAPCPNRPLKPAFDEQVEGWLDTFSDPLALKQWLAILTYLDEPAAALYVSGPPGAGKTLLAEGIARLWTDEGPTKAHAVTNGWNDRLLACPFVFADEKLPDSLSGNSAVLREFLQERNRTLSMKYIPNATIKGAVRFMLAANNVELLRTREVLTADDIKAIAERFIHVKATPATVDYLKAQGGPQEVGKWVLHDRIASHALYLKGEYPPDTSSRWLIRQDPTRAEEFAIWLAVSSGNRDTVCNAIVKAARHFKPGRCIEHEGKGIIKVTLDELTNWWEMAATQRQPAPLSLSQALGSMSATVAGDTYYVRREFVEAWNNATRVMAPGLLAEYLGGLGK